MEDVFVELKPNFNREDLLMSNYENIVSADNFLPIPPTDDSTLDLDEISFNPQNIPSALEAYLKRAGQAPLLKAEEEKILFETLQVQKTLLEKILFQLQDCNILDSEYQERLKQVFRKKRAKDNQMELSLETLGRLQDLILDLKADVAVGLPNKQDGDFFKSEVKIIKRNTDYGENHQVLSKFSQAEALKSVLNELQTVIERIQDIQQHLVKANLLLVASIVKQFSFNEFPLSFLDLMQEGSIGLMKAIYKFRLEKGYRFSTYATWWISQAIRRALDEQSQLIRLPIYVTEMRRRAAKASMDLMERLGREPKMSELAEEVNIKDSRLRNLLQAPKDLLSLDSPIGGSDDGTTVADLIKDKVTISPEEEMLSKARQEALEHILSTLTPQQARVIKLRYGLFDGECHTLAQIGKQLKITRERVRQIEAEALNKLRHPTRRHYWKELLD